MEQTITISFTPTKIKLFGSKQKKSLLVVDGICINGSLNRILPKSPALIHIRQTSTTLPSSIDSFECLANKLLVEGDNLSLHTQKHPTQGSWIDADKNKCIVIKVEAHIERNRKGDRLIECTEVLALQDIGDESYLPINTETNEEYNEYITTDGEEENDDDNLTTTNSINRKSERHVIFAHWLVETYGKEKLSQGTGLLDVAGGNGMISRTLTEKYGIPLTLVDPNPRHETSNHDDESDKHSTLFKVIPHPLNGDGSDLTSRDDDIGNIVSNCSLICGLHPDQATEPIVTLALRLGVPFAILPCCVMPSLFPHRFQKRSINQRFAVRSYSTFCQYLLDMAPDKEEYKVDHLPFVGRNKVIYRSCGNMDKKKNNHRQQTSSSCKVPLLPLTLVLLVTLHCNHLVHGLSLNYPRHPATIHSTRLSSSSTGIHQDEDGNCVFGKKDYWDEMYGGQQLVTDADYYPQDAYSWYCGWSELSPFWRMLVPDPSSRVVIAGIGNDITPVNMYDDGYTNMFAYDYSEEGVNRARELFGDRCNDVELITADATNLPLDTASVDATFDKGTLDAIYITGKEIFIDSVKEMTRYTAPEGLVVSISRVIDPDVLLETFDNQYWENINDGTLSFATDGEATIDLGAELYSWKRTKVPFKQSK